MLEIIMLTILILGLIMNNDKELLAEEIIKIIKNITRSDNVDVQSSNQNLDQWDSLAYMSIISEIEINYDIEVTEENINNFGSVKSIIDIILNDNQ